MKLSSKALVIIRNCVIFGTIIFGAAIWLRLPIQTVIHLESQTVGNKMWLLIVLMLPLFALIPQELPEFHTDSKENEIELEKAKQKNAVIQLVHAVVEAVIVFSVFALLQVKI